MLGDKISKQSATKFSALQLTRNVKKVLGLLMDFLQSICSQSSVYLCCFV